MMNAQNSRVVAASIDRSRDHLADLLHQTGQGNHGAFTEFYRHTSRRVYGLAVRTLVDPQLSEEVTQEVFVVVWLDAGKYNPAMGTPLGWLLTIAHRRAVDKVRSHQLHADRQQRWAAASHTVPYDEVAESVCNGVDSENLSLALASLTRLQREAIDLAYFGCLTYQQVAIMLSIPLPTIKSRIRDGLQNLRTHLQDSMP